MPTLADLFLGDSPKNGGLSVRQVPTPFGLRFYINNDGSYGGQMMPKGYGWLGMIANKAHKGNYSSELSAEDDSGMFPLMVPTLSNSELSTLLGLKDSEKVPEAIYRKARQFADQNRAAGRSEFKEIWE